MNIPHWELSVLCKSVQYLNLSAASSHVGLSQPQLSRIIAKIELELGISLLDRSVRRHSSWTPEARRLAAAYARTTRGFEAEIEGLVGKLRPTRLAVGCLEGLIEHAAAVCHTILAELKLQTIELDVHDIDTLENHFLNGTLDAIYTCREIVRRKPKHSKIVATQILEPLNTNDRIVVRSHYEHRSIPQKRYGKPEYSAVILSNSLTVRKHWIERYGGKGIVPSKPVRRSGKNPHEAPVYLFAADKLPSELWARLVAYSSQPPKA